MTELTKQIIATAPIRSRVAFALGAAGMVLDALKQDKDGYALASDALDLAWKWEEGQPVAGASLAEYIDSDTSKDLGTRELDYDDQSMISALIAITMAIAYAARKAYEAAGENVMPSPIWEVADDSILEVVSRASAVPGFDEKRLERMAKVILTSGNEGISKLGTSITRQCVLEA
jgi:hypothetical protein